MALGSVDKVCIQYGKQVCRSLTMPVFGPQVLRHSEGELGHVLMYFIPTSAHDEKVSRCECPCAEAVSVKVEELVQVAVYEPSVHIRHRCR